ncbi:MAG: hypothetical protein LBB98_06465 [Treponema sp.]|nr:hypothetical protein [Treponema sp.]
MQTKAAELAGILEGKTVFYMKIETPNDQESIDKTTQERQRGIGYRVEGNRIAFTAGKTAAAFEILETNHDQPDGRGGSHSNLSKTAACR